MWIKMPLDELERRHPKEVKAVHRLLLRAKSKGKISWGYYSYDEIGDENALWDHGRGNFTTADLKAMNEDEFLAYHTKYMVVYVGARVGGDYVWHDIPVAHPKEFQRLIRVEFQRREFERKRVSLGTKKLSKKEEAKLLNELKKDPVWHGFRLV